MVHDDGSRPGTREQGEAWLFEALDRIHAAIHGAETAEQLWSRVLDGALDIFGVERAWSLFPCEPDASNWQIQMLRERGAASAQGQGERLEDADVTQLIAGANVGRHPARARTRGGTSTAMAVAIRPRDEKPSLLALEQPSAVPWSLAQERLLAELARRVTDALNAFSAIQRLQDSQRKMEAAENMARLGYWDRDFVHHSITGSREALRIFDLDTGQSTSLAEWQDLWSKLLHPEDRQRVGSAMASAIAGGPGYDIVYRVVHPNGQIRVIHSRGEVSRDENQQPRYMFGIMQDITEQKQLEEQLRQAQKMEAIGRLAGGVAHDFNNLLTVINGCAELALGVSEAQEDTLQLLREIRGAGDRAASLTRQLLAFSRRQLLEPAVVNLSELLEELQRLLRRLIGDDIELTLRIAPGLWRVMVDVGQFEQAIINLAVNARDAMPAGGKLTISAENSQIDTSNAGGGAALASGAYVRISVRDTGQGMDEGTLAHAFEPFFTTKPAGRGTGLGLAMVYGFVKQSGGHVEVQSAPGKETTFSLYLPRTEDAPAPRAPEPPSHLPMRASFQTILLVEDADAVRRLCRLALEPHGYQVLEAADGQEALAVAARHPERIDLLLTDLVMPRLGGAALVEQLRRARPGLPVIYMSGYVDQAPLSRQAEDPNVRFVAKPFRPAFLLARVRELLAAARLEAGEPSKDGAIKLT